MGGEVWWPKMTFVYGFCAGILITLLLFLSVYLLLSASSSRTEVLTESKITPATRPRNVKRKPKSLSDYELWKKEQYEEIHDPGHP
jgi:hypothetical protein